MTAQDKVKHTMGPWFTMPDMQNEGKHPLHDNRYIVSGMEILCKMTDCENQEANARLIASAPELLDACKVAHDTMLMSKKPMTHLRAFKMLEQAITKAEGKQ